MEATAPVIEGPEELAVKVMNVFARPDESEQRWHAEIRPYLEKEYALEAEYIDPARIPFDKILSGPVLEGDAHNPQILTAGFKPNAGHLVRRAAREYPPPAGSDWSAASTRHPESRNHRHFN
ncbi:hypothetical protein ACIPVK_10845 [Paeniglutamicibacter sp. MACA_103]|uniref:hypothetical protein n=1 Tax=Paeniglutamicibacter sp. MACA_103 TaxID=3377337 RepID=UPI003895CF35